MKVVCHSFFRHNLKKFVNIWRGYILIILVSGCVLTPQPVRNPVVDKSGYSQGRILIVPLYGKGDIGLLNKKGYYEKVWSTKKTTFYGELIGNKNLIVHISKENDIFNTSIKRPILSGTGLIAIYNDKGIMETSFEDQSLHHDIAIKTPSRIFALSRHFRNIQHKGKTIKIVDDSVVEIDLKLKKIIERYPLLNYFSIPDKLPKPNQFFQGSVNIFHTNSIDYIKANPINGNEGVLITMRNFHGGTIALIDLKINKLLWQSPKGLFSYPHDGKFTKDGTITVFDNGDIKEINSRIVEMDINTNEIIYEYDPLKSKKPVRLKELERWNIFSPYVSGVQKTDKGYLVTSGMQGKIFEISKDHQIVWELPAAASAFQSASGKLSTSIFKAKQYDNFQ